LKLIPVSPQNSGHCRPLGDPPAILADLRGRELRPQIAIAKAAVARFELSADVLAFDTMNFDTHIATVTHPRRPHFGQFASQGLHLTSLGRLLQYPGPAKGWVGLKRTVAITRQFCPIDTGRVIPQNSY
jgi:hypothetical protein